MRRELTANKAQALLARTADDVADIRVHVTRDHLADIRALDARIKHIGGQTGGARHTRLGAPALWPARAPLSTLDPMRNQAGSHS
jgi:hypothetical protein